MASEGFPYLSLDSADRGKILDRLGLDNYEALETDVPSELRAEFEPELAGQSEAEVYNWHRETAARNRTLDELTSFLGGGLYDHFVPSTVHSFLSRSEFLTAYTPYQPEINQGILQAMFEFQSMVSELFGLPVTNASMYDGASALAEAALMAVNVTRRETIYYSPNLFPSWQRTLKTYIEPLGLELRELPSENGRAHYPKDWEEPAAVCMAYPNCWGAADAVEAWTARRPDEKCVGIAAVNPLAMGLLTPPGELGWDVAVGEGQPLGLPLNGGGPQVGLFSATEEYLRKMPGRLVGETEDRRGNRCYVLTLQTREQHIRRGRATSNICTNHALMALLLAIGLSTLGPEELRSRARKNYEQGNQLQQAFENKGFEVQGQPVFNELGIKLSERPENLEKKLAEDGWLGGYWLDDYYVCAATEQRTTEEIEAFVKAVTDLVQ